MQRVERVERALAIQRYQGQDQIRGQSASRALTYTPINPTRQNAGCRLSNNRHPYKHSSCTKAFVGQMRIEGAKAQLGSRKCHQANSSSTRQIISFLDRQKNESPRIHSSLAVLDTRRFSDLNKSNLEVRHSIERLSCRNRLAAGKRQAKLRASGVRKTCILQEHQTPCFVQSGSEVSDTG
jgi:hypothetical protein